MMACAMLALRSIERGARERCATPGRSTCRPIRCTVQSCERSRPPRAAAPHVTFELEGRPFESSKGSLAAEKRRLAREPARGGRRSDLGHPLHAKAIETDGTLYLDEKNWGKQRSRAARRRSARGARRFR